MIVKFWVLDMTVLGSTLSYILRYQMLLLFKVSQRQKGIMNIFYLNNKLLFPPQQLVLVTVDIAVGRSCVSAADHRN